MAEEIKEEIKTQDAANLEAAAEAKSKLATKELVKGMAAKLAKCKKVTIKVPIDKQNEQDKFATVQINGYTYQIERGKEVTVPVQVKTLLERGGYL
ncbi:MAG: hypothetical protein IKK20_00265 [Clostridia bacterium]|nr:hypothetical protein [Clostridia bacterium]